MMMKLIIEILMLIVLCFIAFTLYTTEKHNTESHNKLNVKLDLLQEQFNNWITITIE